jgi:hypothetical protein
MFWFGLLVSAGGCYRSVAYETPDGRRFELRNVGFDTRIGRLVAETPDGRVEVEGAASEAASAVRAAELAAEMARLVAPQ